MEDFKLNLLNLDEKEMTEKFSKYFITNCIFIAYLV